MSKKDPGTAAAFQDSPAVAGFAEQLQACFAFGIVMVDDQRRITAFDAEAERVTGSSAARMLSGTIQKLPAPLRQMIEETFSSGHGIASRLMTLSAAKRGKVEIRVTTAITKSAARKPRQVAAVLQDMTGSRQLELELPRLERLAKMGMLAAGMAHEIKNALVAGRTFVDLLAEKNQDTELARVVRREMGRIDSIVSQMLRFAAPAKRTFSPVRLHEVLEHSLRLVQPELDRKAIALNQSLKAAQDIVEGDDNQLQQAFVNLFLNALEAMEQHGTLTVATETIESAALAGDAPRLRGARQLRVTVQDTGPGIPAENIGRLFEPFFTTKKAGTGLGLPITRRIIEEHHGALRLESQPNQGATFSILLPILEKDYGQDLHSGDRQRHPLRQPRRASARQ